MSTMKEVVSVEGYILYTLEARSGALNAEHVFYQHPDRWSMLLAQLPLGFPDCPEITELWMENEANGHDEVMLWSRK